MTAPDKLHHNLIQLPADRRPLNTVGDRHEIVLLFDCEKSNPNGDPDTGNMPRVQPDSLKGLVTDVCLKRKIRNFFTLINPHASEPAPWLDSENRNGYGVFVRENAILQNTMEGGDVAADAEEIFRSYPDSNRGKWEKPSKGKSARGEFVPRAYHDALCSRFFDLRAFGGVVSTEGPLRGSFYGQIRGPIQFTFSESLDKVLPLGATITRCAVASEKEQKQARTDDSESGGNRTMGRKFGIDYGLFRCHIHVSPAFAAKTGFTYYDLDNFIFALVHMFDEDHAAGRHLRVVGLVDFQHKSPLGNAPAHKLFDLVTVKGKRKNDSDRFQSSDSEFPQGLQDYVGYSPDGHIYLQKNKYGQVAVCTDQKPESKGGDEPIANITARRIIWEIPAMDSESASE